MTTLNVYLFVCFTVATPLGHQKRIIVRVVRSSMVVLRIIVEYIRMGFFLIFGLLCRHPASPPITSEMHRYSGIVRRISTGTPAMDIRLKGTRMRTQANYRKIEQNTLPS